MNSYLSLVERRAHQAPLKVMFVGPDLAGVTGIFRRGDEPIEVEHASSLSELQDLLDSHSYDCVMIDQRRQDAGDPLKITALAASQQVSHLIVMAAPDAADTYRQITGIQDVLETPVAPQRIVECIVSAAESAARVDAEAAEAAGEIPAAEDLVVQPGPEIDDNEFETSVSAVKKLDGMLWQKFLPLVSFLYKKMAIAILSALFLTFLFYGVMIIFFIASSSWSMPIELSRGHELVLRAERDLGQMKVRQNQVRQALQEANANLTNANRKRRDAELVLSISKKTVELEIARQTTMARQARAHIKRLNQVIADFNRNNKRSAFARNLNAAYRQRTITMKSLNSGTLAILETLHRMALISNELAMKEIERDRINHRLLFLKSLKAEMGEPEIRTIVSAGSDFVQLARQVIEAKATIAEATKARETAEAEARHLNDSLTVVSSNIASLVTTPVGRAISEPVTVLFVPYANASNYSEGSNLYGCYTTIFGCSSIGTTGSVIEGETSAVHPLFGKPLRGIFVEANITRPEDTREELVHVGRPPLFF